MRATAPQPGADPGEAPEPSLKDLLGSLWVDIPGALSDRVSLAAIELRCARHALGRALIAALAVAILAATAWIALWAMCFVFVTARGHSGELVLLVAVLVNALGAWYMLGNARRWLLCVGLPATLRSLTMPAFMDRRAQAAGEAAENPADAELPGAWDSRP